MANSGTNTNKSQFFITYRSCRHLDNKHTIFGKMVGGLETLDKMERIETDVKSRPKQEIKIVKAVVRFQKHRYYTNNTYHLTSILGFRRSFSGSRRCDSSREAKTQPRTDKKRNEDKPASQ